MSEETTITVRGVDMKTWKEFQKALIDNYGNLYGYLGPELTKALEYWLEKRSAASVEEAKEKPANEGQGTKIDYEKYTVDPRSKTHRAIIREAMKQLGGEATIQQVCSYLNEKYPGLNQGSISTSMSDLSVNGPPSSLYPMNQRFLERVSRGRYRVVDKGETHVQ